MAKRIIFGINYVDPFAAKTQSQHGTDAGENKNVEVFSPYVQTHDEALVMHLVGTMESSNCDFAMHVNATAFRTDWEQTKYKATLYSVYMMLGSLVQIIVLLRQLLHAQKVSSSQVRLLQTNSCISHPTTHTKHKVTYK